MDATLSRVISVLSIAVGFILSNSVEAQMGMAHNRWDLAKQQYERFVDAAESGNRDSAAAEGVRLSEFMGQVCPLIRDIGQKLHPQDIQWLGDRGRALSSACSKASVEIGTLASVKIREVGYDYGSDLDQAKDYWEDFEYLFNELWTNFAKRHAELVAALRAFEEECGDCD